MTYDRQDHRKIPRQLSKALTRANTRGPRIGRGNALGWLMGCAP